MQDIVRIEKLVFGGQGLARLDDGKVVFVWNALPGETVRIEYIKKKKDHLEAIAREIIEASAERRVPKDEHFLSSSPWQIMSEQAEQRYKQDIATETYSKIGDLILHGNEPELYSDPDQIYGYRNKMEFSFAEKEDGSISLAFFERGKKVRMPIEDAALAHPAIMNTAKELLAWVQQMHIPLRSLKSLIVRSATDNQETHTIAALFIKDKLSFPQFPPLPKACLGFHIYYSTHKSPASVPTELIYSNGTHELTESILGTQLSFGLLSFFQINPPVFIRALQDIAAFIDPKEALIDFYAGVGAISLPLAGARTKSILVESNEEACDFARKNIEQNHIANTEVHCLPAEKITDIIDKNTSIVVDPPRAGLHKDVIQKLLTRRPPKIIYLSCNISTQARDMRMLSLAYRPIFIKLYNFFPRTPHVEGLVILERLS